MPKLKVIQKPDEEVPAEILAKAIVDISAGMRKLRASRLTDEALVLLVSDASKVGRPDIRQVLRSLHDLERIYLKKRP